MDSAIWIILMVVLVIAELMTMNFITIWFAIGSLAAVISSLLGAGTVAQLWIFTGVSLTSLILTKPFVKKKISFKKTQTNADRVIGKIGVVTNEIGSDVFAGEVKINGQTWSAVSIDNEVIEKESKVKIVRIEGVKLVVERLPVEHIN